MKKHLLAASLLAGAMAPPSLALAADQPAQFIDFECQRFDGQVHKPAALVMEGRERPKWERLFHLKKSLREALHRTASDAALK